MCIMFVKRSDQTVSSDLVAGMYHKGNKDGAGVMTVRDGTIVVEKVLGSSEDEVRELFTKYQGQDIAFHLRHQSVGKINLEMAHPYLVTSRSLGHPRDIYMMHNGTIRDIQVQGDWSDSRNLAEFFLRPLLADHPDLIDSLPFTRFLSGLIGKNKLIFLNDLGKFTVINSGLGRLLPSGIWVSTTESINPIQPVGKAKVFPLPPIEVKPPSATQPRVATGVFIEGLDGKKRFRRNKEPVLVTVATPVIPLLPSEADHQLTAGLQGTQLATVISLSQEAENIGAM
jgi:hypothetical protein